eukprot:2281985-Pleurochrysis_carterae.AAC.3
MAFDADCKLDASNVESSSTTTSSGAAHVQEIMSEINMENRCRSICCSVIRTTRGTGLVDHEVD